MIDAGASGRCTFIRWAGDYSFTRPVREGEDAAMSCEWLSIKETADQFKVSEVFIRRMIARGDLKVLRLPGRGKGRTIRICRDEMLRFRVNVAQAGMDLGNEPGEQV